MFSVFHKNLLVGHTRLEFGDPPMGVAHGLFIQTDEFDVFRDLNPSEEIRDGRMWLGFKVVTENGEELQCGIPTSIIEYGSTDEPFETHITCHYISYPKYEEIFPHHVANYFGENDKKD